MAEELTKNRRRLLDMAAGGTGRIGDWVEVVTYDATDRMPERKGAIVHATINNGRETTIAIEYNLIGSMLYLLSGMIEQDTAEERETHIAQLLKDTDIIDNGRHITAAMQAAQKYE